MKHSIFWFIGVTVAWSNPALSKDKSNLESLATRSLAEFQWKLIKNDRQLSEILSSPVFFNGTPLLLADSSTVNQLQPCSLWHELAQADRPSYETQVLKTYGTDKGLLIRSLEKEVQWIKAPNFKGLATVLLGDRIFITNSAGTQITRALCFPDSWSAHDGLMLKIGMASPTGPMEDARWARELRRLTFYSPVLGPYLARLWMSFMLEPPQNSLALWVPLCDLTLDWLKSVGDAPTPRHPIDVEIQKLAREVRSAFLTQHARLAPSEAQFFKKFYLDEVFPVVSQMVHLSALTTAWQVKNQRTVDREFKQFEQDEKNRLEECCFDKKGLKNPLPYTFSEVRDSSGLKAPPSSVP